MHHAMPALATPALATHTEARGLPAGCREPRRGGPREPRPPALRPRAPARLSTSRTPCRAGAHAPHAPPTRLHPGTAARSAGSAPGRRHRRRRCRRRRPGGTPPRGTAAPAACRSARRTVGRPRARRAAARPRPPRPPPAAARTLLGLVGRLGHQCPAVMGALKHRLAQGTSCWPRCKHVARSADSQCWAPNPLSRALSCTQPHTTQAQHRSRQTCN